MFKVEIIEKNLATSKRNDYECSNFFEGFQTKDEALEFATRYQEHFKFDQHCFIEKVIISSEMTYTFAIPAICTEYVTAREEEESGRDKDDQVSK